MFAASPASSSSSSSSSTVHAGSQVVDPATHSPALLQLIDIKIDSHVIVTPQTTSSIASPRRLTTQWAVHTLPAHPPLALPHQIHRLRPHRPLPRRGHTPPRSSSPSSTLERVFLGALIVAKIVASKYTSDSTLKNVHWALCTGVFGKRDIGRIEREFLDVLDWDLGVGEAECVVHHEGLVVSRV
ncbi:hypothetical protein B0H14DRAFT_3646376 [Mycena olivaceomarginata]|nr:hypothetical protein B0H14DRAFT_3646376 [Mycena olivaceomarginata]